ncbi:MAG: hypothetical protein WDM90_09035 [Ferruginibacter sp.]
MAKTFADRWPPANAAQVVPAFSTAVVTQPKVALTPLNFAISLLVPE